MITCPECQSNGPFEINMEQVKIIINNKKMITCPECHSNGPFEINMEQVK